MTEQQNTPELRFSEFKDEWKLAKFKDIFIFHNNLRKPIKESLRVSGQSLLWCNRNYRLC